MVRISKIEIIGRNRMNRKSRLKNNPKVPIYVAQSHWVGWYIPQDDGRKSRWRLVTENTKRSSHIPTFTIIAITNSAGMFILIFLNHRNCGVTILHAISDQ